MVAHSVSDHTQPCLTSVKLMELAGPIGHSPCNFSITLTKYKRRFFDIAVSRLPKKLIYDQLHKHLDNKSKPSCTYIFSAISVYCGGLSFVESCMASANEGGASRMPGCIPFCESFRVLKKNNLSFVASSYDGNIPIIKKTAFKNSVLNSQVIYWYQNQIQYKNTYILR